MPPKRTPLSERLWRRVDRRGLNDCWLWFGGTNGNGYGVMGRGRGEGMVYVHRLSWELEHGPIPPGLEIDHLCHVRLCCNPRHLAVVTHAENNRRSPTIGTIHAQATHCPKGHPYDEANTYRPPGAPRSRMCRACMAERESRRVRDHRKPTCRHGHPYPENCPTDSKGKRICPTCAPEMHERRAEAAKRANARRWVTCGKGHPFPADCRLDKRGHRICPVCHPGRILKTHCPRGHPYDEANTYVASDGSRRCRICSREKQRLFHARNPDYRRNWNAAHRG